MVQLFLLYNFYDLYEDLNYKAEVYYSDGIYYVEITRKYKPLSFSKDMYYDKEFKNIKQVSLYLKKFGFEFE